MPGGDVVHWRFSDVAMELLAPGRMVSMLGNSMRSKNLWTGV